MTRPCRCPARASRRCKATPGSHNFFSLFFSPLFSFFLCSFPVILRFVFRPLRLIDPLGSFCCVKIPPRDNPLSLCTILSPCFFCLSVFRLSLQLYCGELEEIPPRAGNINVFVGRAHATTHVPACCAMRVGHLSVPVPLCNRIVLIMRVLSLFPLSLSSDLITCNGVVVSSCYRPRKLERRVAGGANA